MIKKESGLRRNKENETLLFFGILLLSFYRYYLFIIIVNYFIVHIIIVLCYKFSMLKSYQMNANIYSDTIRCYSNISMLQCYIHGVLRNYFDYVQYNVSCNIICILWKNSNSWKTWNLLGLQCYMINLRSFRITQDFLRSSRDRIVAQISLCINTESLWHCIPSLFDKCFNLFCGCVVV